MQKNVSELMTQGLLKSLIEQQSQQHEILLKNQEILLALAEILTPQEQEESDELSLKDLMLIQIDQLSKISEKLGIETTRTEE